MNLIETLEQEEIARLGRKIPDFAPGDTVVVSVNVVEGERKRLQAFEGVVIAKRNRGLNSGFIVRKISAGEGVERTFQTYSPDHRQHRGEAQRLGAPRQALLSARPFRQVGAYQGKARHSRLIAGRFSGAKKTGVCSRFFICALSLRHGLSGKAGCSVRCARHTLR